MKNFVFMRSLAGSALLLGAAVFSCLGDNVMDIHAKDHRAGQESGGVRRRVDPHQRGAGARMAARFLLLSDLSAYGGGGWHAAEELRVARRSWCALFECARVWVCRCGWVFCIVPTIPSREVHS